MKHVLLSGAAALSIMLIQSGASAAGFDNQGTVNQDGDRNSAAIVQQGSNNRSGGHFGEVYGDSVVVKTDRLYVDHRNWEIDRYTHIERVDLIPETYHFDVYHHYGDRDEFGIAQIGDDNSASVEQLGSYNNGGVAQLGDDNDAEIEQAGIGNRAFTLQYGDDNDARTFQEGRGNVGLTRQKGDNNYSLISQLGHRNTAVTSQIGYRNISVTGQSGAYNVARHSQVGAYNFALTAQAGYGNRSAISQTGR